MTVPKILLQLDVDSHASSFDAVVAVDSGVDHLLSHGSITAENVVPLVHGAMFTRGGSKLASTAIFVGGSNVAASESVLAKVLDTFFGPVRVSVLFDANGCNTTAAAAVVSAKRHMAFEGSMATVLAGTGPVGLRVARMLASEGCHVRIASRDLAKAQKAVHYVGQFVPRSLLTPVAGGTETDVIEALAGSHAVFACGAAGVQLLSTEVRQRCGGLKVAIDLNAVPPAGIEGIEPFDAGREENGCLLYGAIGVGGLKMKTHKAAIAKLFESNDHVLDCDEIYAIAKEIN